MPEPKRLHLMFFSAVEAFAVPLLMLIATPLLLQNLGEAQFGIWAWINAAAAFSGLINFGFAESLQTLAASSKENISSLFYGNVFASIVGALVIGALFNVAVIIFPLPFPDIGSALIAATLFFALRFVENTALSLFKAHLSYGHSSFYSFFSKCTGYGIQIYLLLQKNSFVFSYSVGACVSLFWILIEVAHLHHRHQLSFKDVHMDAVSGSLKKQKDFFAHSWIQNSSSILSGNLDKILVGIFLSPTVLAYYSIGGMVVAQLHLLFASALQIIVPEFSARTIKRETKIKRYWEYSVLYLLGYVVIVAIIFAKNSAILHWWLKDHADSVIAILPYFLIFEFFYLINVVPYFALTASRKVKEINHVLLPMYLTLALSGGLLFTGISLESFILVRSVVALIASLLLQKKGVKEVYAHS